MCFRYFRLHSWKAPAELMKGEEWPGVSVVKVSERERRREGEREKRKE